MARLGTSPEEFMDIILEDVADLMLVDAKKIYKGVTRRTPVKTGQTRASWNVSTEVPNFKTIDTGTGLQTRRFPGHVTSQVWSGKDIKSIHIANGKRHIGYLEDGSATVEAHGMVAATMAEL